MNKILACNECGTTFDLASREGQRCGLRHPGGVYCNGVIEGVIKAKSDKEVLRCSECERKADNLEFAGKNCNIRFGTGQYCKGILIRESDEN
jgi:hypothetical protein